VTGSTTERMLLADEYYCLAVDDRTGRLRVRERVAGLWPMWREPQRPVPV
jgi:hypothetical protein